MTPLRWLYRHVLISVPVGVGLLVLIAAYITIGSGFAGVRESLEMDELLFFNWWPFKVLVVALIINLIAVTIARIPLTPPRYGVWCIHLGIILLLISLSAYYRLKVEGIVPLIKGQTSTIFYDRWDRALYVQTPFSVNQGIVLTDLPRFKPYDDAFGNADYLEQPTLKNLEPEIASLHPETKAVQVATLAEAIGAKDPITLDVIGYYPYGETERWVVDPASQKTGLKLSAGQGEPVWIVASEQGETLIPVADNAVVEHRHLPTAADIDMASTAAKRLHKLSLQVGEIKEEVFVEPGETYEIGQTGYSVKIEGFTPQFTLSSGDAKADALTTLITHKAADGSTKTFRRMVLSERDIQTDFELGVEGAGPFGKRLREGVLDDKIRLAYEFKDPTKILPTMESVTVKYILFTAENTPGITMVRVSSRESSSINKGEKSVDLKIVSPPGMFDDPNAPRRSMTLNVQREDHLKRSNTVRVVPVEKRNNDIARAGAAQVVRVRIRSGDWEQIVAVPFDQFVLHNRNWQTPRIQVPGAQHTFQIMLGNQRRILPVAVRLDDFEAVPYAGGDVSLASTMREFKSHITFLDQAKGVEEKSSAGLNHPAFFSRSAGGFMAPSESWVFSQASWNPENLDWTALQVGNRPFVRNMTFACVLIFGGLLYAFYLKPIIIRQMKARALRDAQHRQKPKRVDPNESQELAQPV